MTGSWARRSRIAAAGSDSLGRASTNSCSSVLVTRETLAAVRLRHEAGRATPARRARPGAARRRGDPRRAHRQTRRPGALATDRRRRGRWLRLRRLRAVSCLPLSPTAQADCSYSIPRRGTASETRRRSPAGSPPQSGLVRCMSRRRAGATRKRRNEQKFADLDRTLMALPAAHVTRSTGAGALAASK